MVDQRQNETIRLEDSGNPAPPIVYTSHILVAAGLHELCLVLGRTKQSVEVAEESVSVVGTADWFQTVSMPLSTARILAAGLTAAVARYEQVFGRVPRDPNQPQPQSSDFE